MLVTARCAYKYAELIINTDFAMGLGQEKLEKRYLRVAYPEQIRHVHR